MTTLDCMKRIANRAGFVSLSAMICACSSDLPEPLVPASYDEPHDAALRVESSSGGLAPSEGIIERCDLPDTLNESPHFDFDDSTLRPRGKLILDSVMICMLRGELVDEGVTIVGHADPRGTEEYNRGLGMRRAAAARAYLVLRGVMPSRITIVSRGELDAQGTDSESWQLDRRVEIHETKPGVVR